ncbi:MLO-like protein 10 [Herrania umbratica]|uniref:MLO-like protein n=1 Tax=Herrania umbratica TaxID=108875 RepID=A0A6J1BNS4_9ROSI|nr:MLO-like protein 10 [Herrania umbratica]XP_021301127.1 MLO-like protein 10 [Herrania umbratica]
MRLLIWYFAWGWLMVGETVVMGASESSGERKLYQTPTWAVAGVCAVIIIISILLEKVLHKLGTWFTERHKRALYEALDKVKAELMVLGFISLLLTFCQSYIARICIPTNVANTMLPCKADSEQDTSTSSEEEHRRRLLWFERRFLASVSTAPKCNEGHEPLISTEGLHELHILIFFLAVFHVLYSFVTMMLGRLKIRGWKVWEQETLSHDYEFSNDPSRFRLTHETSFVKAHTSFWTRIPFFFYIGCFFRQFFRSVGRVDYLTLRNGFITVHLAPGSKFDFQKYIKRSLEDDFKIVVGVSPVLWASFVIFLLLNVEGWQALLWASMIPVIIILAVGTKLQAILTKMALEITERHAVVQGIPLVQGSDKYFWFGRPQLILYLIHFALFQNAFQITYFLWILYSFGLDSCFHGNLKIAIIKVSLGVGALCLCSYITLPLYALVTQMGSRMKKSIFDEQTSKALKKWHMAAKKKRGKAGRPPTRTLGGSASPASTVHSTGHTLQRFKTTGHSTRSSYAYEDHDMSDLEAEPLSPTSSTNLIIRADDEEQATEISETHHVEGKNEDDFSFVKPAPVQEA